jgi:putative oxygen-independent coproporphyrinogen III oxidase
VGSTQRGRFPDELPVDAPELADAAGALRTAYVHVPYCRRRCPYCDFAVVTAEETPEGSSVVGYVDALIREIAMEPSWAPLDAVNFGGGTPTTLDPVLVGRIIGELRRRFGIDAAAEVSIEANPEDITPDLVAGLVDVGVTRMSLGVQSFDVDVLEALGRLHRPPDASRAVSVARRGGIQSVSIDLIYGTPGESLQSWMATVERALSLGPDHLSAYALTVERGTELSRLVLLGAHEAPDPDDQADKFEAVQSAAPAAGLRHYEISNFARRGHPCRYNLATWAQGEYIAFGLGAHGHRDGVRRRNVRRLDVYLDRIAGAKRPEAGTERLGAWAREQERLILGLRRRAGVTTGEVGRTLLESEAGQLLQRAGVINERNGRIVVDRPLLTDEVNRAVLSVEPPSPS